MDDHLRKSRELLQNPYAFLGEDGYEYSLPKSKSRTRSLSSNPPITSAHQKPRHIEESRKLLQNQYAHIDDDGGYSALSSTQPSFLQRLLPEKREHYSDDEIESIATILLKETYRQRHNLWDGKPPKSPFEQINPSVILKDLGYSTEVHETLDLAQGAGGPEFNVAGVLDRDNKRVLISRRFPSHIRHFTLAHELGHAVLHQGQGMHRDRPVDGASQRSGTERDADKFAVFLTMPSKLVTKAFKDRFILSPFFLTPETEFSLFNSAKSVRLKSTRDLSRHLACSKYFNRKNFISLAEQFNVSPEAMAIRLEELGLIRFDEKN